LIISRLKNPIPIILISITLSFSILPFIKIDVYTSARGIIKADKERVSLSIINSGKVVHSSLLDNKKVMTGDTLLILDETVFNEKIKLATHQREEINDFINDLNYLLSTSHPKITHIKSNKYKQEYAQYQQKILELNTRYKKTKLEYNRNQKLYKKGVIAQIEYDDTFFNYSIAINAIDQLKNTQKNNWQASLTEHQSKIRHIESEENQLIENKNQLIITAPIDGILKNVKSLETGTYILSGAPLAEISPDSQLIVECFINPSDIGLLHDNNEANYQIDAFNYNQWGLADGKITEISKDVDIINDIPVFKVRCSIHQKSLQLKNGFHGHLKKGMTLNARFQLTERTLFDLLYDKVDDWLNPNTTMING